MSVKEIDEIKEQFKKVISYSQGIENPVVDDLFEKWLEGKRDFIEAMGGKLIYEFPKKVFFELTGADPYEIKLLHAVIWLSLTTYAWQDYDSVCGAFYNGLYYLEEVL